MVSKNSFTLRVATRTTPFFAFVSIIYVKDCSPIPYRSYLTKHSTNTEEFDLNEKELQILVLYCLHLADKIYQSFHKNKYTLGVFVDLSKALDTVDKYYLKNLNNMELTTVIING